MHPFPHHYSVVANADAQGDVALEGQRLPTIPSAPPTEFGGPGDRWSPETLFVAAVADCFVLTFRGIAVMKEEAIDLNRARPQKLTTELAGEAQLLITMGCGDACPYVPGFRRDDWPLDDPKGQPVERVRAIRDDIRARVEVLVVQEEAR